MPFDSRLKIGKEQAMRCAVKCNGPEARAWGVSRSTGRPEWKDSEQEELVGDEFRQVRGGRTS